jgi:hypothetical protein
MADITACLSTGKDNWATPRSFFEPLCLEFDLRVDLAAASDNHLLPLWYGLDHPDPSRRDGLKALSAEAEGWAWCNPPYSRGLQPAFVKFCASRRKVVMLLPARTDTRVFHDYIWNNDLDQPETDVEVRFVKGRIKFVGAEQGAPFPSMVVAFHPKTPR